MAEIRECIICHIRWAPWAIGKYLENCPACGCDIYQICDLFLSEEQQRKINDLTIEKYLQEVKDERE
ncbi:hypothetical protein LCGC14_0758080 [marine sediment metagenome]|uniref:Uncharacterized protein n=1 Tax=marine sediment metagenome TaxID=412755 RepID=A0A0F9SM44_9ZZZZ